MTKVLIVDDSKFSLLLLKEGLQKRQPEWHITECQDPTKAMGILAQAPYQLAIVDFNMPGINGINLLREMRQKHADLKLILCTANVQESIKHEARALGVVGIAYKPLNDEILDRIASL